jgi:branched-chain amino acid transport system ATP-binding protein
MTPVLEVDSLQKWFGGLHATRNLSLNISDGELHAVIGPNGAGKTTLISQLFGELRSDAGTIRLTGQNITTLPTHARARLGMARSFQITTLVRELTVLANVMLAIAALDGHAFRIWGSVYRDRTLIERALAALARVGLAADPNELVANLSHGEQRLLELAIALVGRPKLILLDEPMAGLGHEESRAMTELLRGLKRRTTIILVEHDMDAVFGLADRITVLVRGEVIAVGTPEEIRQHARVREAYLGEDA